MFQIFVKKHISNFNRNSSFVFVLVLQETKQAQKSAERSFELWIHYFPTKSFDTEITKQISSSFGNLYIAVRKYICEIGTNFYIEFLCAVPTLHRYQTESRGSRLGLDLETKLVPGIMVSWLSSGTNSPNSPFLEHMTCEESTLITLYCHPWLLAYLFSPRNVNFCKWSSFIHLTQGVRCDVFVFSFNILMPNQVCPGKYNCISIFPVCEFSMFCFEHGPFTLTEICMNGRSTAL